MNTHHPNSDKSTAAAATATATDKPTARRITRAMTEFMAVERTAPGLFVVRTGSGGEYTVDVAENRCTCPDYEHRGDYCKHLFRVAFETGAGIPGQCTACAGLTGLPCADCYLNGHAGGR